MDEDRLKVEECLEGSVEALAFLRERYHACLVSILVSKGAGLHETEDLLADLWGDCVPGEAGRKSLLAKFSGRCPVKNWLIAVAIHRLLDLKRKQRRQGTSYPSTGETALPDGPTVHSPGSAAPQERDLLHLLRDGLQSAFTQCPPSVLLMLRLVHVHELTQREVGRMWGWHESKVSRTLGRAMEEIEAHTLQHLKKVDPWLELKWEDLLQLCELQPVGLL